jgi:hypothetical protein
LNGDGCTILSKKYKCGEGNIIKLLRNNNIKINTNKSINFDRNYFHTIDTWSKAYLLGLLDADGYIDIHNQFVQYAVTDLELVQYLANCIKYPLDEIKTPKISKRSKLQIYKLKLCSNVMVKDLINNGCVHQKTYYLKFPTQNIVPENLMSAWFLGFLDGDGCIRTKNNSLNIQYRGTVDIIHGIRDWIVKNLNLNVYVAYTNYKNHEGQYAECIIRGGKESLKFLDYIYKDAEFYLQRKYDKYQAIKAHYN